MPELSWPGILPSHARAVSQSGGRVVPVAVVALVLERGAVALLEFLPATARARVVAPDLWPVTPDWLYGHARLRACCGTGGWTVLLPAGGLGPVPHLHRPLLRRVLFGIFALHAFHLVPLPNLHLPDLPTHLPPRPAP